MNAVVALLAGLGSCLAFLGLATFIDRVLLDPTPPEPWWRDDGRWRDEVTPEPPPLPSTPPR